MSDAPASFGPREAQPLDNLLGQAAGDGWNFFEKLLSGPDKQAGRVSTDQLEADSQRLAADARALFGTPEGRRILEWLCDISFRRPIWFFGVPGDQVVAYAASREGQNALLFTLLKLIASARSEAPPQRPGVE